MASLRGLAEVLGGLAGAQRGLAETLGGLAEALEGLAGALEVLSRGPGRPGLGGGGQDRMNERMNIHMNGIFHILQDFAPYRGCCPKRKNMRVTVPMMKQRVAAKI